MAPSARGEERVLPVISMFDREGVEGQKRIKFNSIKNLQEGDCGRRGIPMMDKLSRDEGMASSMHWRATYASAQWFGV